MLNARENISRDLGHTLLTAAGRSRSTRASADWEIIILGTRVMRRRKSDPRTRQILLQMARRIGWMLSSIRKGATSFTLTQPFNQGALDCARVIGHGEQRRHSSIFQPSITAQLRVSCLSRVGGSRLAVCVIAPDEFITIQRALFTRVLRD